MEPCNLSTASQLCVEATQRGMFLQLTTPMYFLALICSTVRGRNAEEISVQITLKPYIFTGMSKQKLVSLLKFIGTA